MPEKGKTPEWERIDNRAKIFLKLLEKPLTFTELQKETGFSKSTLSQHLKSLKQQGVIFKTVERDKIVYRTVSDEELLFGYYKTLGFDFLLEMMSQLFPIEFVESIKIMLRAAVKAQIELGKKEVIKGKPLSDMERAKLMGECLESTVPPELRIWFQKIINMLKNPEKETLAYFRLKGEHVPREERKV